MQPTAPFSPHLDQIDQPVDNAVPVQLQSPDFDELGGQADQQVAVQQVGRSTMAEDRALLPKPFSGTADEDSAEFWRRLELFIAYKGLAAPENIKLFKAMMVEGAQDWLKALDPVQKNTVAAVKEAFNLKFVKPSVLKFCSACDLFHKRQSEQETVDQYANRLRNSAKRADMSESTLLYAFVSSLKEKLAGFVLEKTQLPWNRLLTRLDWQKCR